MRKKTSYAWVIVAACFILTFAAIGIVVNCASIFLKPVSEAMGFSRTSFSLCFTIISLALIVGSVIIGKLLGKIKLKILMTIGAILTACGYLGYSFCTTLPMFYVASVIIGLGASWVTIIPCSVMITNWFVEKRGLAIGIAFTGSGFGGMLFAPVANWLIQSYGWQQAYLVLGVCIAVLLLPVCLFLVSISPAEKGLTAYGVRDDVAQAPETTGITSKAFFKTKAFWLLAISAFMIGLINLGVQGQIPAHLTDNGLSATFATGMVTLYMAILIVGKILLGAIYDKKGIVFGSAYLAVVFVAAMVALLLAKAPFTAIIFACFFGLANSMTTVTNPVITANIVGPRHYAAIYTIINLFFNIGMAIGAPLSNAIYDAQGGYNTAFIIYAVVAVVLTISIALSVKFGKGYSKMKVIEGSEA